MEDRHAVAAVFEDQAHARAALDALRDAGFGPDEVGVAARRPEEARDRVEDSGPIVDPDPTEGILAGGLVGGVVGWLAGIATFAVPGAGAIFAAGALAAAVSGAGAGAAIGGLIDSLTGAGVPSEHADWYQERLAAGSALVTVRSAERRAEAREILRRHGGREYTEADSARS
jgi:hypothetical protein